MVVPREIIWLQGAPGAGKGANTPFILKHRGLNSAVAVSSLLDDDPEVKKRKDAGELIPDAMVGTVLLDFMFGPGADPVGECRRYACFFISIYTQQVLYEGQFSALFVSFFFLFHGLKVGLRYLSSSCPPPLSPPAGMVVDGFPRTSLQADFIKLLYEKLMDLHRMFKNSPDTTRFPRPLFKVVVLYVDEEER
jgi:hypothetical protein